MTYCINPDCQNPQNPDRADICQSCGSKMLLRDRYRAIHSLAQGKFGTTFIAVDEDKPSKPPCVIKQFLTKNVSTRPDSSTFSVYAAQLDKLSQHPQIPELLASFEQDGCQYLVHEYIEGQNLAQELAEAGPFNENQIRDLLDDVLPVLQFVHNHQVIHRDIKPANIIQPSNNGELVLVDFSAASVHTGLTVVKTGKAIGSAEYAAPEQTKGKAVFASDLYSLGLTCLHLLTGLSPFDLFDIKSEAWVWEDYLKTRVSHQLSRILNKLIERDLKLRYQSAAEVLKDLKSSSFQAYLPSHQTKLVTALGGAAMVLLSLTLSNHLLSPAPQTSLRSIEPEISLPEIPYTLPELDNSTPRLWQDVPPMSTLASTSGPVWSVAVSPDGQTIASGSTDGSIQIWHVSVDNARVPIRVLNGHSEPVWSVTISPDGQLLASGSADKTIKIWNIATGELLGTLKGHAAGVFSVAFSSDSQTLASGSFDKTIKLWRINTSKYGLSAGYLQRTLFGHTQEVQSVAFSLDGRTLASGSTDGTVKLWNVRTGKLNRTLIGHNDSVWSVAISPDGETLASGSWDKTIKLWNLNTGTPLRTLSGHSDQIHSVAFSPDGRTLASGDLSGTIKLWNARTGCPKGTLKGHSDWVEVAFPAQGKTLISGSFDDTIKLWRLAP